MVGTRRVEVTLEIERSANSFKARLLANPHIKIPGMDREGVFNFKSSAELVKKLCLIAHFTKCTSKSSNILANSAATNFAGQFSQLASDRDIKIRIGSLPNDSAEGAIWIKDPLDQKKNKSGFLVDPNVVRGTLTDTLRNVGSRMFNNSQLEAPSPNANLVAPLDTRPRYFAVHCTAFAAPDKNMESWVTRNISENRHNKSHGVILPSGRYLKMWDFADRRVWATKTETCKETHQALGAIVNIEIHYFCASNRNDKATQAQYETLADLYVQLKQAYGPLKIVSHREVDRGLRDGHNDPLGFQFSKFYDALKKRGFNVNEVAHISDERHMLRTDADISHHWEPQLEGPLILKSTRPDDCKRDHPEG